MTQCLSPGSCWREPTCSLNPQSSPLLCDIPIARVRKPSGTRQSFASSTPNLNTSHSHKKLDILQKYFTCVGIFKMKDLVSYFSTINLANINISYCVLYKLTGLNNWLHRYHWNFLPLENRKWKFWETLKILDLSCICEVKLGIWYLFLRQQKNLKQIKSSNRVQMRCIKWYIVKRIWLLD